MAAEDKRGELAKALAGKSDDELREMATRLARSLSQLSAHQQELKAEEVALKEDGRSVRETIELMLTEIKKLNIGMDNTVDPSVQEGPFDFAVRFWERVKPRDNQVLVTENIGELKHAPSVDEEGNPLPGHAAMQQFEELQKVANGQLDAIAVQLDDLPEQAAKTLGTLQQSATEQLEELKGSATQAAAAAAAALSEATTPLQKQGETVAKDLQTHVEPVAAQLREHGEKLRESVVAEHKRHSELFHESVAPLMDKAKPHVATAEQALAETTQQLRKQSEELQASATEQLQHATKQISLAKKSISAFWSTIAKEEGDSQLSPAAEKLSSFFSGAGSLFGGGYPQEAAEKDGSTAPPSSGTENERADGAEPAAADSFAREARPADSAPSGDVAAAAKADEDAMADAVAAALGSSAEPAAAPAAAAAAAPVEQKAVPEPAEDVSRSGSASPSESPPPEPETETDAASYLIEAKITLDDGTVQVARVGARDRCKDVAMRFVREHSLKQWFEEPLSRYLKQVESDADTFPVEVTENLSEIRKQYSKK
eukprot:TRINITY_DN13730_c0_g1_i1.p1 TRINITY_DN13730_c0_g1~~TRINITY_DN13730_c0_g1_i1.p1  ORF type:complete len:543 (+),score=233.40 TRINITY_DN13730_c0_g1_i1:91-1719(+)